MPLPAIVAPVLAWFSSSASASCGACSGGTAAASVAVVKHEIGIGLYHAATSFTTFYAFCMYIVTKYVWSTVPPWIKNDVAVKNLLRGSKTSKSKNKKRQRELEGSVYDGKECKEIHEDDELTTLSSIIEKLSALFQSATQYRDSNRKLTKAKQAITGQAVDVDIINSKLLSIDSDSNNLSSSWNIHAALLLYIQLASQLQQLYPQDRIERYSLSTAEKENVATEAPSTSGAMTAPEAETSINKSQATASKNDDGNECVPIMVQKLSSVVKVPLDGSYKGEHAATASDLTSSRGLIVDMNDSTTEQPIHDNSRHDNNGDITRTNTIPYTFKQIFDFAVWAYEPDRMILQNEINESCSNEDLIVVQHSVNAVSDHPGYLGHFLAVNHKNQTVVIGIKGTSTLEDVFMDCCGRSVPYNCALDQGPECQGSEGVSATSQQCIEVQAQRQPKIIYNNMSSIFDSKGYDDNENDDGYDDNDENDDNKMESIEVLSGHERIWIENHRQEDTMHNSQRYFSMDSTRSFQYSKDDDGHFYDPVCSSDNGDDNANDDVNSIRCHEGILISTRRLANKVQQKVDLFVIQNKYQLIVCGHSLGAGASCLLGIILRARFPDLTYDDYTVAAATTLTVSRNGSILNDSVVRNKRQRLHVFAFAPPPVVDYVTATQTTMPFITSIVNNADLIPRSSLLNLMAFIELLKVVAKRMEERGLTPGLSVAGTTSFIRQLATGKNVSSSSQNGLETTTTTMSSWLDAAVVNVTSTEQVENKLLIMKRDEVVTAWDDIQQKLNSNLHHPEHLYVPGRVIVLFDERYDIDTSKTSRNDDTGVNGKINLYFGCLDCTGVIDERTTTSTQQQTEDTVTNTTTTTESKEDNTIREHRHSLQQVHEQQQQQQRKVIVTDGASLALRFFELDSFRFMTDHATVSYEDSMIQANLISPNE
jgi:predicted transcriptional regulator